MSLAHRSVPFHVSPSLSGAMAALDGFLEDAGYHAYSRRAIVRAAAIHGTPTASVELCDEDEAEATEAWISALPEAPFDGPAWDHEDTFLDVAMLAEGTHPLPFGPEPPDAPDAGMSRSAALGELIRTGSVSALPSISGGSPAAVPFEPSQADWDDYSRWSRELDARYAAAEARRTPTPAEMRAWYDAHEHDRPDYDPLV